MKIKDIMQQSESDNLVGLKTEITKAQNAKKRIAVRLVSLEQHMPEGTSLNKWATKVLGFEIRKTVQHVYELAHIVRGVIAGNLGISEPDYWKMSQNDLVQLSAFITKDEYKPRLAEAVEAVKSGEKVRQKLAAIRKEINGPRKSKPKQDEKPEPEQPREKIKVSLLEPVIVRELKNEVDRSTAEQLHAIEEVARRYLKYISAEIDSRSKTATAKVVPEQQLSLVS